MEIDHCVVDSRFETSTAIKLTTSTATLARCHGLIGGAATDHDVIGSEAHLWAAGERSRRATLRNPGSAAQVLGRRAPLDHDRNAE